MLMFPFVLRDRNGGTAIRLNGTIRRASHQSSGNVVMRSPCAGAALGPPLRIVPSKALSESLSLSHLQAPSLVAEVAFPRYSYNAGSAGFVEGQGKGGGFL